eukprot:Rhum_TRINITY_DN2806_c0_g1::Rhum_TRINITY_DN2806_c0_g1_i1::g.8416::m.8416
MDDRLSRQVRDVFALYQRRVFCVVFSSTARQAAAQAARVWKWNAREAASDRGGGSKQWVNHLQWSGRELHAVFAEFLQALLGLGSLGVELDITKGQLQRRKEYCTTSLKQTLGCVSTFLANQMCSSSRGRCCCGCGSVQCCARCPTNMWDPFSMPMPSTQMDFLALFDGNEAAAFEAHKLRAFLDKQHDHETAAMRNRLLQDVHLRDTKIEYLKQQLQAVLGVGDAASAMDDEPRYGFGRRQSRAAASSSYRGGHPVFQGRRATRSPSMAPLARQSVSSDSVAAAATRGLLGASPAAKPDTASATTNTSDVVVVDTSDAAAVKRTLATLKELYREAETLDRSLKMSPPQTPRVVVLSSTERTLVRPQQMSESQSPRKRVVLFVAEDALTLASPPPLTQESHTQVEWIVPAKEPVATREARSSASRAEAAPKKAKRSAKSRASKVEVSYSIAVTTCDAAADKPPPTSTPPTSPPHTLAADVVSACASPALQPADDVPPPPPTRKVAFVSGPDDVPPLCEKRADSEAQGREPELEAQVAEAACAIDIDDVEANFADDPAVAEVVVPQVGAEEPEHEDEATGEMRAAPCAESLEVSVVSKEPDAASLSSSDKPSDVCPEPVPDERSDNEPSDGQAADVPAPSAHGGSSHSKSCMRVVLAPKVINGIDEATREVLAEPFPLAAVKGDFPARFPLCRHTPVKESAENNRSSNPQALPVSGVREQSRAAIRIPHVDIDLCLAHKQARGEMNAAVRRRSSNATAEIADKVYKRALALIQASKGRRPASSEGAQVADVAVHTGEVVYNSPHRAHTGLDTLSTMCADPREATFDRQKKSTNLTRQSEKLLSKRLRIGVHECGAPSFTLTRVARTQKRAHIYEGVRSA